MTKHTPGPSTSLSCGCVVGHELQSPYFPIRHCPLHAATPELLASAKEWLELWFFIRDQYPEVELPNTLREDGTDACGRLGAAIAKAEGR